jgi:hypothetical protein
MLIIAGVEPIIGDGRGPSHLAHHRRCHQTIGEVGAKQRHSLPLEEAGFETLLWWPATNAWPKASNVAGKRGHSSISRADSGINAG